MQNIYDRTHREPHDSHRSEATRLSPDYTEPVAGRGKSLTYRSISDPTAISAYADDIRRLADSDKEALGFLAATAYDEAIQRRRVVVMLDDTTGKPTFAGYLMFSGVFPNAKIQQIAVVDGHRRRGVGSALLRETISRREAEGCLRITAAVADNLPGPQAFYEKNGFGAVLERPGGRARKRTITVRARDLDNEHLLSAIDRPREGHPLASDLGLRSRGAGVAPLYAIDLNVLFDAIRSDRERASLARRVIGAALAHRFRLAVTPEFGVELSRGATPGADDPTFALAMQLPRLPAVDAAKTEMTSTH